jgi:hypothetical protein
MGTVTSLDHAAKRFAIPREKARQFQQAIANLATQNVGSNEGYWALKDVGFAAQSFEPPGADR